MGQRSVALRKAHVMGSPQPDDRLNYLHVNVKIHFQSLTSQQPD